jgi:hypothetical protein
MASGRAQDVAPKWWHERDAMQRYHVSDPALSKRESG